jgi:hypothetical protein
VCRPTVPLDDFEPETLTFWPEVSEFDSTLDSGDEEVSGGLFMVLLRFVFLTSELDDKLLKGCDSMA